MDKNHRTKFRQYYVRVSWQVTPVQSKPKTHFVQDRTDDQLRYCVSGMNSSHCAAADIGGKVVHFLVKRNLKAWVSFTFVDDSVVSLKESS